MEKYIPEEWAKRYDGRNITLFIPGEKNQNLLIITEGTGDNLFPEDIKRGYVDYINWSTCKFSPDPEDTFELPSFKEVDGGMVMFRWYVTEASFTEIISKALFDAGIVTEDIYIVKGGESL